MPAGVHPVILCGGSGTGLWPVSRQSYPKQFAALFDGRTLYQRTLERVRSGVYAPPLVMTGDAFRFIVTEQAQATGVAPGRIVIEPDARNTAPAICVAARMVAESDPEGVLLVLPSDHLIDRGGRLSRRGRRGGRGGARGRAGDLRHPFRPRRDRLWLFELADPAAAAGGAASFRRFVEKPDAASAERMLASGRFLWNSGMFAFGAGAILDAFARHAPAIDAACAAALATGRTDLYFFRLGEAAYAESSVISVDYAVMEHVGDDLGGRVVPIDCGWNDLGSWATVWQESRQDPAAVAVGGNALAIDCRNSLLHAGHPDLQIVGIGLRDVVAVATRDAVLVADRKRAQEVRSAVETLKATGAAQATEFSRCYRPWGWYETLARGAGFQVKQNMVPAFAAEPRVPGRALGRRRRSRRGDAGRGGADAVGQPVDRHSGRRGASAGEPGRGRAAPDRGAVGRLSRRGRHHPLRGRLRAGLTRG